MQKITIQTNRILALLLVGIFATTSPALAEKPSWAGGGNKGKKHEQTKRQDGYKDHKGEYSYNRRDDAESRRTYFDDHHRNVVQNYYTERYKSGRCPPGLAKKGGGCKPPGQNKKWHIGKHLPRDVIFHDLPPRIAVQLGSPPERHRFVRVASDILLIAVGTGMIIDAIEDISSY